LSERKVEIVYFYSDLYENERKLSKLTRKLTQKNKDIQIRLVNVDDPHNEELTGLYDVNTVPLIIFLTPKGEIAARRYLPLSAEDVVHEIADQVNKGALPDQVAEEVRAKILQAFSSVTKRNELTELIAEQIENDLRETSSETDLREMVNSHISAVNHTINDLQELRKALQMFSKKQNDFLV